MNLLHSRSAVLLIISALGVVSTTAFADITGFNNGAGYTATGNPSFSPSSPVFGANQVTLTVAPNNCVSVNCSKPFDSFGIVFNNTPQTVTSWSASFVYLATDPRGFCFCDGTAFIIQNAPAGAAAQPASQLIGGYFGYLGLPDSLAIELSPDSSGINPGGPGTGLYFSSSPQYSHPLLHTGSVALNSQHSILVNVFYNGGDLTEMLTDITTGNTFSIDYGKVNIPRIIGSSTGYIGFSAASGAGFATQTISDFSFCDDVSCGAPPTPEPAFYGATATYVMGLAIAVRRRRARRG